VAAGTTGGEGQIRLRTYAPERAALNVLSDARCMTTINTPRFDQERAEEATMSATSSTAPVREGASPPRRGRATRSTWKNPAEWTAWQFILLGGSLVVLAVGAFWLTWPGNPLGGAAPLEVTTAFADGANDRYVYRLVEPPAGRARMQATLQATYDAHKEGGGEGLVTLLLLRRTADVQPFITGTGNPDHEDVVGRVSLREGRLEAAVRPGGTGAFVPVELRW
jgi:hypothetical protein